MSKQSNQNVILKVLYTIDNQSNLNFLARSVKPILIKTVQLPLQSPHNPGMTIGLIPLKKCLDLIASNSPELFINGSTNPASSSSNSSNSSNSSSKSSPNDDILVDFSIYSKDVVEPDEPFVGHGLYSKIVQMNGNKRNSSASSNNNINSSSSASSQNLTIIAGRVCKNFINLYSSNNSSNYDTLEIRLKLNEIRNTPIQKSMNQNTDNTNTNNNNNNNNHNNNNTSSTAASKKKRGNSNNSSENENSSPNFDDNTRFVQPKRRRQQKQPLQQMNPLDSKPELASRTQSLPFLKNTLAHRIMLADLNSMESENRNDYVSNYQRSSSSINDRFANFDKLNNASSQSSSSRAAANLSQSANSASSISNAPVRAKRNRSFITALVKVGDTPANQPQQPIPPQHPIIQCINCTSTTNPPYKFHKSGIYEFGNSGFLCTTCNTSELNNDIEELRKRGKLGLNGLVDGPYGKSTMNNSSRSSNRKSVSSSSAKSIVSNTNDGGEMVDYLSSPSSELLFNSSSSPIPPSQINLKSNLKPIAPRRYYNPNISASNTSSSLKNINANINNNNNNNNNTNSIGNNNNDNININLSTDINNSIGNFDTTTMDFDELNEFINLNSNGKAHFLSPIPKKSNASRSDNNGNINSINKSMIISSDDDLPGRSSASQLPLTDLDPIYHSSSSAGQPRRKSHHGIQSQMNMGDEEGVDDEQDDDDDDRPVNATKLATTLINFDDDDEDKENLPPLEEDEDDYERQQQMTQPSSSQPQYEDDLVNNNNNTNPHSLYHTDISPTLNKILQSISELSDSENNRLPNSPSAAAHNHHHHLNNNDDDVANNWISLFTHHELDEDLHFNNNNESHSAIHPQQSIDSIATTAKATATVTTKSTSTKQKIDDTAASTTINNHTTIESVINDTANFQDPDPEISRVLNNSSSSNSNSSSSNAIAGMTKDTPNLRFDKTPKDLIITPKDTPSLNQSTTPNNSTSIPTMSATISSTNATNAASASTDTTDASNTATTSSSKASRKSAKLQGITMPSSPFFLIHNDDQDDDQEDDDMSNVEIDTNTSISVMSHHVHDLSNPNNGGGKVLDDLNLNWENHSGSAASALK